VAVQAPTLQEAAARVGGHCWSERRLFEILGAWVPSVPEADAKVMIDRHSAHAAWRAEQWEGRLPVLAGTSRPGLVVAPNPAVARLFAAAAGIAGEDTAGEDTAGHDTAGDDAGGTVGRLAAAYRVLLPRVMAAYREHRSISSVLADGPTRRTLAMALDDLMGDWAEGEALLQRHLTGSAAVRAAADRVAALEALVAAAR